jgi:hypothetical protein
MTFATQQQAQLSLTPFSGRPYRCCKFHLMLRAVPLLPFLGELQRFKMVSHPTTLVACYLAAWPLPGLDSHQWVEDDLQDTLLLRPLVASGFVVLCQLAQPQSLFLASYPSSHRFASGFLQTPLHSGALAFG